MGKGYTTRSLKRSGANMSDTCNTLILCTGNSARSLIAETLVRELGKHAGFAAYSAGSKPKGEPHPAALQVLAANGHDIAPLSSKSWDVYAEPDAPEMRIVITVCGNAAGETCPIWPGHPLQVHWGVPDPAAVEGDGQQAAFEIAYQTLKARVVKLVDLDVVNLSDDELKSALTEIHATTPGATE